MNILQQLSQSKLTREEIEALLETCELAVKMYHENLESLDRVIALYEQSKDSGIIKMTIETEDGFETKSKSIEDVKAYREEVVKANEEHVKNLANAGDKLKELTKIFEE